MQEYVNKEILAEFISRPFDINPAHGIHSSPNPSLGPKKSDQVDRLHFDRVTFRLKFPSIDNIVEETLQVGDGIALAKVGVSRAFRNLRVNPGDALYFGIQWQGHQYLNAAVAFRWVHGI